MRRRPWALVILAILHFIAPVGNVVLNAVIQKKNIMEYLVFAMSPEYLSRNWMIVVAPIVAGIAIYSCKKWSFYVYIIAISALFFFSYTGYLSKNGSIGLLPVILVYLVNILVVTYFLIPAVRSIYFDRRMRWWEIQARYKTNFKCKWRDLDGESLQPGTVANFSENGLFLKSDIHPEDNRKIHIEIPFNNDLKFTFEGEAIIHNRADAIGFGVKFEHNKESRKNAKALVIDLEEKGLRITASDIRPEDSFSYWVRTLVTTGKGLVPNKESKTS